MGGNLAQAGTGNVGGHIIEDEGVPLPPRTSQDFVGNGVTASDGPGNKTTISIDAAASLNKLVFNLDGEVLYDSNGDPITLL